MIRIAIIFAAVAVLAGCLRWGCDPPAPPPVPGIAGQLRELGGWFLYVGGIVAGLGVVVRVAFAAAAFLPVFGALSAIPIVGPAIPGIAAIAATGGATAIAIGAAFSWLAGNLLLVSLSCVAACVAWALWHRRDIRRWLDRRSKNNKEISR